MFEATRRGVGKQETHNVSVVPFITLGAHRERLATAEFDALIEPRLRDALLYGSERLMVSSSRLFF